MRVHREAAMSDTPDWSAIDRHLTGAATPDDTREVDAWIAADSRNAALLDALRTDGDEAADAARWNVDAAWARVAPRSTVSPSASSAAAVARRAVVRGRLAGRGGAAAGRGRRRDVVACRGRPAAKRRPRRASVSTAPGQRASFELVDGSRVTLNAGSRLRWRADYGARTREVQLEGEGYFEVRHDAARPFRVHARGAVAEDLGTRFTVRAYPEVPGVEVAVAEGRVALQALADTTRALLDAGDVGRVEGARARVVARGASTERFFGWTAGALVFDGVSLTDALPQLERWYDIDVVIPDARLAGRPLVARFSHGTAAEALDAIALALDARWSRRGRTVTLEPRP
jgi:transmembrane sensor